MMISWCIVVSVLLGFIGTGEALTDPRTKTYPIPPDPRCEQLIEFVSKGLVEIQSVNPSLYSDLKFIARVQYGVNMQNRTELRTLCQIIGAKTLREVYDMFRLATLKVSYEDFVQFYQNILTGMIGIGGYTNFPRFVQFTNDMRAWVVSVPEGATVPSEATDLTTLTRFFEVMQVKYGSRWMSLMIGSILITNATKTAKELYESKSGEDVMKILDIDPETANGIYKILLLGSDSTLNSVAPNAKDMDLMAEGITLAGELGLFTLTY